MTILESFIPTRHLFDRAVDLTSLASTRPDVPTAKELNLTTEEQEKVRDLLVDKPDWQISADGRPVAGLLHMEDFFRGAISPSIPLLYSLLPVLGALTGFALHFSILTPLAVLLGLASVVAALSLSFAMPSKADAVEGWAVSYAAPLIMTKLLSGGLFTLAGRFLPAELLPGMLQWLGGMVVAGMLVAAWVALMCLWQAPKGHKMETCESLSLTVTLFTGASIVAALLAFEGITGGWLARHTLFPIALALPWLAGIALGPWRFAYRHRRTQALKLLHQGMTYSAGANRTRHKSFDKIRASKVKQISFALADSSHVFRFGTSLGILAERGSPHGIPKGHPACITADTAFVHVWVFGRTGGGKTSSILKPWLAWHIRNNVGGVLVLDGKQVLANEFRGCKGFTVIDQYVLLSPFEGLNVDAICTAILDANAVRQDGHDGSNFFVKSGIALLTVAVKIMFALRDAEQEMIASIRNFSDEIPPERKWFVTPACLRKVTKALGTWNGQTDPAAAYVEFIKSNHPAFQEVGGMMAALFGDALDADRQDLENVFQDVHSHGQLAAETRTGVDANLDSFLGPLFASKALLKWTTSETGGYQPESVCHGAKCGLYLPPEHFGNAGKVFSNLVKGRVQSVLKQRPNNFQELDPAATSVDIVEDEVHSLVSATDLDFSSKCRSWKCRLIFATQTQDVLFDALGEETARALLSNFQTKIYFANPNSLATLEDAMETIGKGTVTHWSEPTRTLSMAHTARLAAASPIFDVNHPDHDRFSSVVRAGGGGFEMQKTAVKLHEQRHGQVLDGMLNAVVFSKIPLVESFNKKDEHWVTSGDWHDILGTGRALVQTLRGGEKSHDFVDCPFMGAIPDDLLDPENPQHPQYGKGTPAATATGPTPDEDGNLPGAGLYTGVPSTPEQKQAVT
jgi:hypothetical protein